MQLLASLGVAAAIACGTTSAAARPAAMPAGDPAHFHTRTLLRDLNGDGRADSAVLVARGPRPDSLHVVLTLFVDGVDAHREEWGSEYELIDVDDSVRVRPRIDAHMRERFDAALASVTVVPLDTAELALMSYDPAVLDSVTPRPTSQIVFSYGYESTVVLAWDAGRRRLIHLWSCC